MATMTKALQLLFRVRRVLVVDSSQGAEEEGGVGAIHSFTHDQSRRRSLLVAGFSRLSCEEKNICFVLVEGDPAVSFYSLKIVESVRQLNSETKK